MVSWFFLSFFLFSAQVLAFHFSFNPPSECDDLGLTWSGGAPPFKLHIIPVFGTPREVSIPNSAFSNGKGSHSIQLPFKKDVQVLFTMSDSTGFNAGGSSNVYTVSRSKGGACNATNSGTAFVFQLNSNLQQCRPFIFTGYDSAVPPVTIGVIIPGGTALTMISPPGQTSYSWTVNAARGTSMIFFMTDSQGRQGGSSDIRSVGASDDNGCLDNSSPSTTTNAPGPTQASALPSSSTSATPTPTPTPTPISAAGIAGAIIGSVLFLAVAITLALFFLKRKPNNGPKTNLPSRVDLTDGDTGTHMYSNSMSPYGHPSAHPSAHPPHHLVDSGSYLSTLSPSFKYPASEASFQDSASLSRLALYPPQPHHSYSPQSQYPSANIPPSPSLQGSDNLNAYANPTGTSDQHSSAWETSTAQPKAASESVGNPSQAPLRFIMHTDAEDESPYDGGFVELPPQYFERPGDSVVGLSYDTKHPL